MNLRDNLIKKIEKNEIQFAVLDQNKYEIDNGIGVKPIISKMKENLIYFKNKEVYDTVIGKAAAFLLIYSGASYVYGRVMSQEACIILEKFGIEYSYTTKVDFIKNRDQTGMCPLEDAVLDETDPKQAFSKIVKRIDELMRR